RNLNREGLKRRGLKPEAVDALKEAYKLCFRAEISQEQAFQQLEESGKLNFAEVRQFVEFLKATARGKHGRALETQREVLPPEERDGRLGGRKNEDADE